MTSLVLVKDRKIERFRERVFGRVLQEIEAKRRMKITLRLSWG